MRNIFRSMLQRVNSSGESDLVAGAIKTLRQTEVFGDVPVKHIRQMARMMHYRDYRKGETIYHEQDPGLGLYVVQSGQVRLITEDVEGSVHVLKEVGQTCIIGAASLAGAYRRRATAQAIRPSRLLGFFRPDYKALVRRHPQAGAAIAMALSRHIANNQIHIIDRVTEEQGKLAAVHLLYNAIDSPAYVENEMGSEEG